MVTSTSNFFPNFQDSGALEILKKTSPKVWVLKHLVDKKKPEAILETAKKKLRSIDPVLIGESRSKSCNPLIKLVYAIYYLFMRCCTNSAKTKKWLDRYHQAQEYIKAIKVEIPKSGRPGASGKGHDVPDEPIHPSSTTPTSPATNFNQPIAQIPQPTSTSSVATVNSAATNEDEFKDAEDDKELILENLSSPSIVPLTVANLNQVQSTFAATQINIQVEPEDDGSSMASLEMFEDPLEDKALFEEYDQLTQSQRNLPVNEVKNDEKSISIQTTTQVITSTTSSQKEEEPIASISTQTISQTVTSTTISQKEKVPTSSISTQTTVTSTTTTSQKKESIGLSGEALLENDFRNIFKMDGEDKVADKKDYAKLLLNLLPGDRKYTSKEGNFQLTFTKKHAGEITKVESDKLQNLLGGKFYFEKTVVGILFNDNEKGEAGIEFQGDGVTLYQRIGWINVGVTLREICFNKKNKTISFLLLNSAASRKESFAFEVLESLVKNIKWSTW